MWTGLAFAQPAPARADDDRVGPPHRAGTGRRYQHAGGAVHSDRDTPHPVDGDFYALQHADAQRHVQRDGDVHAAADCSGQARVDDVPPLVRGRRLVDTYRRVERDARVAAGQRQRSDRRDGRRSDQGHGRGGEGDPGRLPLALETPPGSASWRRFLDVEANGAWTVTNLSVNGQSTIDYQHIIQIPNAPRSSPWVETEPHAPCGASGLESDLAACDPDVVVLVPESNDAMHPLLFPNKCPERPRTSSMP